MCMCTLLGSFTLLFSRRLCNAGTIAYVAPEVLQIGSMARPADVYSFAMLLLELWEGELVYRGVNTHQVYLFFPISFLVYTIVTDHSSCLAQFTPLGHPLPPGMMG